MELRFRDLEQVISHLLCLDAEHAPALNARLKYMIAQGFPPGVRVGKGPKVGYDFDMMSQMALAFVMLDNGQNPSTAIQVITSAWPNPLRFAWSKAWKEKKTLADDPDMFYFQTRHLDRWKNIPSLVTVAFYGSCPASKLGFEIAHPANESLPFLRNSTNHGVINISTVARLVRDAIATVRPGMEVDADSDAYDIFTEEHAKFLEKQREMDEYDQAMRELRDQ